MMMVVDFKHVRFGFGASPVRVDLSTCRTRHFKPSENRLGAERDGTRWEDRRTQNRIVSRFYSILAYTRLVFVNAIQVDATCFRKNYQFAASCKGHSFVTVSPLDSIHQWLVSSLAGRISYFLRWFCISYDAERTRSFHIHRLHLLSCFAQARARVKEDRFQMSSLDNSFPECSNGSPFLHHKRMNG